MTSPATVYVLNGPNLNLLGRREPEVYGSETLEEIAERLARRAKSLELELEIRQSNHEGHLIDWLHEANDEGAKAVILNAGGFSHGSVALHDAVKAIAPPVIEVHLSNLAAREPFRARSLVASAAAGSIAGLGALGYELALDAAARL
ncbi:MAG: type II 3-dehydroquinate dehydratase [Sphingomonadaceae bacterium]